MAKLDCHNAVGLVVNHENDIFWTTFSSFIAYDIKQRLASFAQEGYHYNVSLQLNAEFYTAGFLNAFLWWLRNNKPLSQEAFIEQLSRLLDPRGLLHPKKLST